MRHKGFIPWDDDIDIGMTRGEYDRFVEIAPKELGSEFSLISSRFDDDVAIFFSKIMLKGTILRSLQQPENSDKCGLWVDVFPYDNIYDNKLLALLYYLRINFYVVLYSLKLGYKNGTTKLKRLIAVLMKFCFFFIPKKFLRNRIVNYPYKLNQKGTGRKAYLTCIYGLKKESQDSGRFDEYTDIEFEGETFMTIKDYDAYLRQIYGDYMQIPSAEHRRTHQIVELDFGKY